METLLLATKFSAPFLRPELTPRPRLTQRLEEGLRLGRRLTLLVAPAGSGKTTLIAEWLQATGRAPAAWLLLDEHDSDPQRFLSYLVAALQRVAPEVGRALSGSVGIPQPPTLEAALTLLINDLAQLPVSAPSAPPLPLVLVLDDYHTIREPAIHEALALLVERQPPQMHLVVATREEPPLPLARWRARGQLTEVRNPDLRFTGAETSHFLNQTMRLCLDASLVAALERRTEGWIAGLQLAAVALHESMALAQQMDVAQWVEAFGGGHRHVLDYLMQEVLERQPAPVRDFVVQTAILDRLTAPLCDAVTGRQDGREMLDRLERNSLFVVPLDDRRTWYRYHQIFADALRGQMQPSQRMALYARAARWCEAQGLLPEAIAYALSALDWPLAAQLIERSGVDMLQRLERATVLGWLRILPQSLVRSRPKLCLIHAWAMLYTAQFSEAEIWATHAEAALAESAGPGAAPAAPDPAPLLGEVDALRATVAVNRGQFSLAIELSQRALLRLPPDQALGRILVHLDLGDAFSVSDDYAAAHQAMAEALHIAEGVANLDLMVVILGSQGALYLRQGQLHRAATVLQRALALDASWRRGVGRPLFALGKPLIFVAAVQYEWNELDTALDTVRQGIELCRQWGHSAHLVDGLFQLAEVWQALGDLQAAQEALREAERHLQAAAGGADTALLSDSLAAEPRMRGLGNRQALLLLREGKLDEVGAWERQTDAQRLLGGAARSQTDFYACIVLARLFLARGDAERASELLRSLDELAQAKGWLNRRIGVLVLRALADEARALSDSALAHLTLALQLGQAEGYVRAFLDQGPAVAPLLARAAQRGIAPSYSSRLLAAFAPNLVLAEAASSAAAAPRAARSPLAEPLSEREIEILRLVAQGLANQQIADRLFITLGTTKWHLNNIYGKLGVASRTQAVALARQLKII